MIDHLVKRKGLTGEIIKTVSGSDLISHLAKIYSLSVYETPIGYKYIADRMLTNDTLIGGEESGGIGYGTHIPERDALLSALYVLEAMVESSKDLGQYYGYLKYKANFYNVYERLDLPLANIEVREKLVKKLQQEPLTKIAGKKVLNCSTKDGNKHRLADGSWLLIRFSGTEPVLRLYCESVNTKRVHQILDWVKDWANSV